MAASLLFFGISGISMHKLEIPESSSAHTEYLSPRPNHLLDGPGVSGRGR